MILHLIIRSWSVLDDATKRRVIMTIVVDKRVLTPTNAFPVVINVNSYNDWKYKI